MNELIDILNLNATESYISRHIKKMLNPKAQQRSDIVEKRLLWEENQNTLDCNSIKFIDESNRNP